MILDYLLNHPGILIISIALYVIIIALFQFNSIKDLKMFLDYFLNYPSIIIISITLIVIIIVLSHWKSKDAINESEMRELSSSYFRTDTSFEYIEPDLIGVVCSGIYDIIEEETCVEDNQMRATHIDPVVNNGIENTIDSRIVFANIEMVNNESRMDDVVDCQSELSVESGSVQLRGNGVEPYSVRNIIMEHIESGAYKSMEDLDDVD